MDKTCEFCGAQRPVVYCQADAAFLCLSCDSKVHSANALSGRHSRNLLCDSCKEQPAFVRCLNHSMLLCRECESRLHEVFSTHRRLMLKNFTGCPSAKHFAALWGFSANEEAQFSAHIDQFGSESCVSTDQDSVKLKSLEYAEPEMGSTSSTRQHKMLSNQHQEQNNLSIMQQIVDLKKLQLSEDDNQPLSPRSPSGNLDQCLEQQSKELEDLQNFDHRSQGSKTERFPSSISQLDHMSCSSSVADPYWPLDSSEFWSQNMQDHGVCEDPGNFDDFNMPEVDTTFRNFDDAFTCDLDVTRPLLDDHDLMWSDIEKETSVEKSGSSHTKTIQDISFKKASSFPRSRLSAESSSSDCPDSGHSSSATEAEGGESSTTRTLKERKKARLPGKQSQLAPRKAKTERHKKIKDRFVNLGRHESERVNVAKSY